jgi:surfeit locus 1 family protein
LLVDTFIGVKMLRLMFSRRWWWTTMLVLGGIALTIRLGFWQLDRQAQRHTFISHVQIVQTMPLLDLNRDPLPSDLTEMEYRQVRASGVYDFEHQVALRNQVWTQSWGDESGYALLTPLILPDGQAMLVERGWIPSQYNTPASWRQLDETGTVTVEGILRLPMVKGEMGGGVPDPTLAPGETRLDFWNFVNLARLQQQMLYPIFNVYIQQAPGINPEALPYRWLSQPDLNPGTHIGYAIQWFFYASLLFFGYPVWLKKQAPR